MSFGTFQLAFAVFLGIIHAILSSVTPLGASTHTISPNSTQYLAINYTSILGSEIASNALFTSTFNVISIPYAASSNNLDSHHKRHSTPFYFNIYLVKCRDQTACETYASGDATAWSSYDTLYDTQYFDAQYQKLTWTEGSDNDKSTGMFTMQHQDTTFCAACRANDAILYLKVEYSIGDATATDSLAPVQLEITNQFIGNHLNDTQWTYLKSQYSPVTMRHDTETGEYSLQWDKLKRCNKWSTTIAGQCLDSTETDVNLLYKVRRVPITTSAAPDGIFTSSSDAINNLQSRSALAAYPSLGDMTTNAFAVLGKDFNEHVAPKPTTGDQTRAAYLYFVTAEHPEALTSSPFASHIVYIYEPFYVVSDRSSSSSGNAYLIGIIVSLIILVIVHILLVGLVVWSCVLIGVLRAFKQGLFVRNGSDMEEFGVNAVSLSPKSFGGR